MRRFLAELPQNGSTATPAYPTWGRCVIFGNIYPEMGQIQTWVAPTWGKYYFKNGLSGTCSSNGAIPEESLGYVMIDHQNEATCIQVMVGH